MSCCGLEFQFLSVPTHSKLPSQPTRSTFYVPNPPSPMGCNKPFVLVADAGWNTVHHQHSSRSSSRFIHTRYLQWLPGWYLQFGKHVQVGPALLLLAAYVPVRGYDRLHGERVRSSSGRPMLYQTASPSSQPVDWRVLRETSSSAVIPARISRRTSHWCPGRETEESTSQSAFRDVPAN